MPKANSGKIKWTEERLKMLKELYPILGGVEVARRMGVDPIALRNKAHSLGLYMEDRFDWTDEIIAKVKREYLTRPVKELAAEIGTTVIALSAKARRLGLKKEEHVPDHVRWGPEKEAILKARYATDGGTPLAAELGATHHQVWKKARKLGLNTIAGHADAGKKRAEKNNTFNIKFFDEWSPDMAYVLGFLFADGCVNKKKTAVSIALAEKDRCVLEFVRSVTNHKGVIYRAEGYIHPRTGRLCQPQVILRLSSTVVVKRLAELGLLPRKTFNDDPFPRVPDEMMPHFIRGYFDGDGCVSLTKTFCSVGVVGSANCIIGMRDALVRLAGVQHKMISIQVGKTADLASVKWSANKDVKLFRDFIYPEGFSFCLERKKQRLDDWVAQERGDRHNPKKNQRQRR